MPTTIEQLELEVQSSSTSAVAGIDALSASLSKLKNAVRGGVGLTSVAIKYAISTPPLKAWIVPGQTRLTSSLPVWKN